MIYSYLLLNFFLANPWSLNGMTCPIIDDASCHVSRRAPSRSIAVETPFPVCECASLRHGPLNGIAGRVGALFARLALHIFGTTSWNAKHHRAQMYWHRMDTNASRTERTLGAGEVWTWGPELSFSMIWHFVWNRKLETRDQHTRTQGRRWNWSFHSRWW